MEKTPQHNCLTELSHYRDITATLSSTSLKVNINFVDFINLTFLQLEGVPVTGSQSNINTSLPLPALAIHFLLFLFSGLFFNRAIHFAVVKFAG